MNKKNNIFKEYYLMISIGFILLLIGILFQTFLDMNNFYSIVLLNIGAIMIVLAILYKNKYGAGIRADERDRRIGSAGVSYSWFFTFILVNVLYWIDHFLPGALTVQQVIGILMVFMIFTTIGFKEYFKRKGDIE